MTASSPDTIVRDLQYNAFHSHPDNHLYTTPWPSPRSVLQASVTPASALQRLGPSAHYSQYPDSFSSLNRHPVQFSWSVAGHSRPEQVGAECTTSRSSVQHGYTETGPSIPQSNMTCVRPHASNRVYNLLHAQPQPDFTTTRREPEYGCPSAYSAPPGAPKYSSSTEGSAPVARVLNQPSRNIGALHVQTQHLASQTPISWTPRPTSVAMPPSPPHYTPGHGHVAFSPGITMPSSYSSSAASSSWAVTPVSASTSVSPAFQRLQGVDPEWQLSERGHHAHRASQLSPVSPDGHVYHRPTAQTTAAPLNRRVSAARKPSRISSTLVPRQQKMKVSKRQHPLNIEARENARTMRRAGVCLHCKLYKTACDGGDPCGKCQTISNTARIFHLPCRRDRIGDANFVRRCNGRFNQPDADFLNYKWKDGGNIHEMWIIWNLPGSGPVTTTPLRIKFREYEPEGSMINSTESQWQNTNGQLVKVEQPPYAVYDTASLPNDVEAHFGYNFPSVDQWIFNRNRHDDIALLTYKEALRLRNQSELVNLALQLQYWSVLSQGYGSVYSPNIPGIKQYDFRAMGHSVYEAYDRNSCERPLPIAINHQMDVASVKILKRQEQRCAKLIAKEIFSKKNGERSWYELFLALFVIIWNLHYIHNGAEGYIKSKDGTHVALQVKNVVRQQMERWDFSFANLIYHWKACIRDFKPFVSARENPDELRAKGNLPDQRAFEYMINMASLLDRQGPSRFPPPVSGYTPTTHSMNSRWIVTLIQETGG